MPRLGYKQTEEHKRKHLDKTSGENNGRWKGGIKSKNPKLYHKIKAKEWELRNPEKVSLKRFRYRERLKNIVGSFSLEEWLGLKKKFNNICLSCKKEEPIVKLTIDHIIPISKEGSNFIKNIQPLCNSCNARKKDKIIDYRELIGEAR